MALRIESGRFKGAVLKTPKGAVTRPTPAKVRAAVHNMLMSIWPKSRVLDLYAGTGVMGLGALSHGASDVTFVERDRGALKCLESNIAAIMARSQSDGGVAVSTRVMSGDACRLPLGASGPYHVVWMDPPYALIGDHWCEILPQLDACTVADCRIVMEAPFDFVPDESICHKYGFQLEKSKKYGKTQIIIMTKRSST